jgi:solute carrier family 25 protein 16
LSITVHNTNSDQFFGFFDALRKIEHQEGLTGLFRGHSATLLRIFPYAGIKFMLYEQFKVIFATEKHENTDNMGKTKKQFNSTHFRNFLSGSLAGVLSALATYPFDLLRTRLAFDSKTLKPSILAMASKIYHEESAGIRNFYRGVVPTVVGMIPYAGVSFLTYEGLKDFAMTFPIATMQHNNQIHLHPWGSLVCGAISGMVAQTCSYPFEIIRRNMQVSKDAGRNHDTMLITAKDIMKTRGLKGFFAGLGIGFVKVVPMFAVSFFSYEYLKRVLNIK